MYAHDPSPVGRLLGAAQWNAAAATCAHRSLDYASSGDGAVWALGILEVFELLGCLLAFAAHLQLQWHLSYSDWLGDIEDLQCCVQTMGKAAQ